MTADVNQEEYVTLNMNLIHWSHMDFKLTVSISTSIFTLKEIIKHHHSGSISSIVICKYSFEEKNELRNANNVTLKDYGISGSSDRSDAPSVNLYYNFKTDGNNVDPILMC